MTFTSRTPTRPVPPTAAQATGEPGDGIDDREIELRWMEDLPDGLVVYAPVPASGRYARDREGRPKLRRVRMRASVTTGQPTRPANILTDSDWVWITSAARNWDSIVSRFGDNTHATVLTLARADCLTIEYDLRVAKLVQPPRRTYPHPVLADGHETDRKARQADHSALRATANKRADELADEWPGVATALRTTTSAERLTWALRAADDLAHHKEHDSLRAFVQSHAHDTKARDDVHHLLLELGFELDALIALGIARSPYIGLGGPFHVRTPTGVIDLAPLPGPHDIRLHGSVHIEVALPSRATSLIIIENRQAAEAICDARPDLPVVWCHGQPPKQLLAIVRQAADHVEEVVVCPDADLGGVRIAARIAQSFPSRKVNVVDIGTAHHVKGKTFNQHSRTHLETIARRQDQIGQLARTCIERGYAVEQEAPARAALRRFL